MYPSKIFKNVNKKKQLCIYIVPPNVNADLSDPKNYIISIVSTLFKSQHHEDNNIDKIIIESKWEDDVNLNGKSIGIEISNLGEGKGQPYTEAQYETLVQLLKSIIKRHNIGLKYILAHSDIAPDRKQDPGSHFDWERIMNSLI